MGRSRHFCARRVHGTKKCQRRPFWKQRHGSLPLKKWSVGFRGAWNSGRGHSSRAVTTPTIAGLLWAIYFALPSLARVIWKSYSVVLSKVGVLLAKIFMV